MSDCYEDGRLNNHLNFDTQTLWLGCYKKSRSTWVLQTPVAPTGYLRLDVSVPKLYLHPCYTHMVKKTQDDVLLKVGI